MGEFDILKKQTMDKLEKLDPSDEKYGIVLKHLNAIQILEDREKQAKEREETAEFERGFKTAKLDAEFERNQIENAKNEADERLQKEKLEVEIKRNKDAAKNEKLKILSRYGEIAFYTLGAGIIVGIATDIDEHGILSKSIQHVAGAFKLLAGR